MPTLGLVLACIVADERSYRSCVLFVLASAAEKQAVPTRGLVLACIVADERSYRSSALFVLASAAEKQAVPTRGLVLACIVADERFSSLIHNPRRVIVHDAVAFCLVCRGDVTE